MELEDGKVKLWHIKDASEFIPGWLGWGLKKALRMNSKK